MATLKEVAEMAGVSVSTVSYVLNGKKTVRPETLKRIEDAVDKLNYCPNLLASSLKTKRSKTIGVLVSDMANIFCVDILRSVEDELGKNGYCMIVCNADNDAEKERKCLRRLFSHNIDGLILMGTGANDMSEYRKIEHPVVCLDRISDERLFIIRADHVLGGRLATEYLIKKEYRKILYIGNEKYVFSQERYQGYEDALRKNGVHGKKVNMSTLRAEEAGELIEKLLEDGEEFDAVFACLDYIAIEVMKTLKRRGILVPDEVGVIGYDDIAPAKFTYPELTSIAQPKEEMGILAVKYLLDMIKGKKIKESQKLLKPWVVERGSC